MQETIRLSKRALNQVSIMQLVDQINCSSEKNLYTIGIFIAFKTFDTVDDKILITKLENYGVKGTLMQI